MSNNLKVVAMLRKFHYFHLVVSLLFVFLNFLVWAWEVLDFSLGVKLTISLVSMAVLFIPGLPDSWVVRSEEDEKREQD